MYRQLFLTVFIFCVTCLPGFCLEISLLPHVKVTDSSVRLADVAQFSETNELSKALGSQIVAPSPPLGENRLLHVNDLKNTLLRIIALPSDITWSGSSIVTVVHAGQEIGNTAILQAINQYLNDNAHKLPQAEIRYIATSLPLPFLVPEGNVTWEIVPSSPSIIDSTRVSIIIRVDGRVRKNMSIGGRFEALAQVAVATASLRRGQMLTPNTVTIAVKDLTEYRSPCVDVRQILGKRLKRSVRAGNVIELSNVEIPPLVHKGQLVKIIVNHGNIHLTATGIARTNGKLNQIIRVRNVNSNKLIYCRVAAPGIVEVMI